MDNVVCSICLNDAYTIIDGVSLDDGDDILKPLCDDCAEAFKLGQQVDNGTARIIRTHDDEPKSNSVVVITVDGGVASVAHSPRDIEVIVLDFD